MHRLNLTPWTVCTVLGTGSGGNGLALSNYPWFEQVEVDLPDDVGDAGLAWLAGGKVACLLGPAGAVAAGAVTDERAGQEDLQQERREGEFWPVRGKKPRQSLSRPAVRAGS